MIVGQRASSWLWVVDRNGNGCGSPAKTVETHELVGCRRNVSTWVAVESFCASSPAEIEELGSSAKCFLGCRLSKWEHVIAGRKKPAVMEWSGEDWGWVLGGGYRER
uniref:Uncharacterized protein n=1 Tax=Cucumis sativus TaxID=3659 RepID=A0A0A0LBX0_CUCSA